MGEKEGEGSPTFLARRKEQYMNDGLDGARTSSLWESPWHRAVVPLILAQVVRVSG